jgi:subtilisin family serine protease
VRPGMKRTVLAGIALAAASGLAFPMSASAVGTAGTATITGGTLSMTSPATLAFGSQALDGSAHVLSATQAMDVKDQTGSAAGWNITVTSTTFASGGNSLPVGAATDFSAPTGACDSAGACTLAVNSGVTYPLVVPDAASAPTAVKMQSVTAGTGLVDQTWTHTMKLAIPANARAGAYTSTWTYSIVSAP